MSTPLSGQAGVLLTLLQFAPKGVKQDLPAAFQAYKVSTVHACQTRGLTGQRHLEKHGDAESQFMLGLFYATGLGGVKEDQGKVSLVSLALRCDTVRG